MREKRSKLYGCLYIREQVSGYALLPYLLGVPQLKLQACNFLFQTKHVLFKLAATAYVCLAGRNKTLL